MFVLISETEIEASPRAVYDVIVDLESYQYWNPFNTVEVLGPVEEQQLVTIFSNLGSKKMTVKHRILEMQPGVKFKWCDVGFFTYFAYGERTRFLTKTEKGTHYRVELKITGILSWLAKMQFGNVISSGMDEETEALKLRTELLMAGE